MSNAILRPLVDRTRIRRAFDTISRRMKQGAQAFDRQIGFPSGYDEHTVHWHGQYGFWALFAPEFLEDRLYCCFGTMNPVERNMVDITCEVNAAREGVNRRLGGVFVRDDEGQVYVAHTGRIGGGRPGIGKRAFWEFYGSRDAETLEWPDGKQSPIIVISRIDGPRLLAHTHRFVRIVEEFKARAVGGTTLGSQEKALREVFTPEFEGTRRGYTPAAGTVEARCDHGTVVRCLHDELVELGHKVANARPDLYILRRGKPTHMFEVKTDTSTTSLHQGVGQLMVYGATQRRPPKRILVLPAKPKEKTLKALGRLSVAVLTFGWEDGHPVFPLFNSVL